MNSWRDGEFMYQGWNPYVPYVRPGWGNIPVHGFEMQHAFGVPPYGTFHGTHPGQEAVSGGDDRVTRRDYGRSPYVVNIKEAAKRNCHFRRALWTGSHLQVTLMSIGVGEDIGLEVHRDVDQFLRIEEGQGIVRMGPRRDRLNFQRRVGENSAIMVPAGTWHNIINTGNRPLKLYSIYAPPEHPFGTVHRTKSEAMAAESSRA